MATQFKKNAQPGPLANLTINNTALPRLGGNPVSWETDGPRVVVAAIDGYLAVYNMTTLLSNASGALVAEGNFSSFHVTSCSASDQQNGPCSINGLEDVDWINGYSFFQLTPNVAWSPSGETFAVGLITGSPRQ